MKTQDKACALHRRIEPGQAVQWSLVLLIFVCIVGCSRPTVTGVWKGSIESADKRGKKWNGFAELTLDQSGNALAGTLVFSHPEAGRMQVPISSGVVANENISFYGESHLPLGSIEIAFHGKRKGSKLTGSADLTARSMLLGSETDVASLQFQKQHD